MPATSRITITVDSTGLSAKARVALGDGVTIAELRAALADAKVNFGIVESVLEEVGSRLAMPEFTATDGVIAEGVRATHGVDGALELVVDAAKVPGRLREDHGIDFRERGLITNVHEGETVGRYTSATSGVPGTTVQGTIIAAEPGAETLPELGAGLTLDDDGTIRSTRDGVLQHLEGVFLDVTDLSKHDGDVDYASGNIHVTGTAWITGSVRPNFELSATADAIIDGTVDAGSVMAGANVIVRGGVLGRDHGIVRAGGNVECHHANTATLSANAVLTVGDHCVSCNVVAGHVRLVEGRGRIAGGVTRTRHGIHAREIGSAGEVPTVLQVGYAAAERTALRGRKLELERQRRIAGKRVDRVRSGERTKGGKSGRRSMQVDLAVKSQERRLRELETELLRGAEIVISDIVHPGVLIRFGALTHLIVDERRSVRIHFDPETETVQTRELDR